MSKFKLVSLILMIVLVIMPPIVSANDVGNTEDFKENSRNALSIGFLGGYQGSVLGADDSWVNGGFWGIQAEYIKSLSEKQIMSFGLDYKQTSFDSATLSDLGIKVMYGLVFWDAYKVGLGARFDVNLKSTADILFGKFNIIPYLQNAYIIPMNSFSAIELYANVGMPIQIALKDGKISGTKLRGIEVSLGLNWMFAVSKK